MVEKPVQYSGDNDVVAEHLPSFAEAFVGSEDDAALFVARGYEQEEDRGAYRVRGRYPTSSMISTFGAM